MMKRILLKLSGEALGENAFDEKRANFLAEQLVSAAQIGPQIAVVIGGGNIWRGRDSHAFGFLSADSDAIGMSATILNAAVLQRCLEKKGQKARVFSPVAMPLLAEMHSIEKEKKALKNGEIVLFSGGTGAPFFTTDSAAVLRALEIEADAVFKGTKVDGIYTADPEKDEKATRFSEISFSEVRSQNLKIMDATAFSLAQEQHLPIFIFDAFQKESLSKALLGTQKGTWVRTESA